MNKVLSIAQVTLVMVMLLMPVFKANAQAVPSKDPGRVPVIIYKGKVLKQNLDCEWDAYCSVQVKTKEAGDINFIWNKGESMPDPACELNANIVSKAEKLKPGDMVEIHVRSNANNVLCGDEAAVMLLK